MMTHNTYTTIMNQLKNVVVNRQTRSIFILIITVFIVFLINALLPTIEGNTHYTEEPIQMSYAEYITLKESNIHYTLTYNSQRDIKTYINKYIAEHPDLSLDEQYTITPPDMFQVTVYTKFFFEYSYWYISTIIHTVSAILIFYATFNFLLTKKKTTYKKYVDLNEELAAFADTSLDPTTFEPWMINEFNAPRKISQHKSNVKYALDKLDKHTSYKIRHLANVDPTNKKCARYVRKKQELQGYLAEEYINEYVIDGKVKHFKYIHPTYVACGYNAIGKTIDSYSLLDSDSSRLSKDSVKRITISILLTVMFAVLMTVTVVASIDKPWYWVMINIIATIAPLVIQIPMAYDYCENFMDTQLINNLVSRRSIALLYLAYIKEVRDAKKSDS